MALTLKHVFAVLLLGLSLSCPLVVKAENGDGLALLSLWDIGDDQTAPHNSTYACERPPRLSKDLETEGFYVDKHASVRDEAKWKKFRRETRSFREAARDLVGIADQARLENDRGAAECAASWLTQLAMDNALGGDLTGAQAHRTQAWMLNAYATAWLKVRPLIAADDLANAVVPPWLNGLADTVIDFNDEYKVKNNLRYWAGLSVMSAGIAANDREKFDWAIESFNMGADSINKKGWLPMEMRRAAKAREYHMYAAAPLIMMAELASANGVNLYKRNRNSLSRLVRLIVKGVSDPTQFEKGSGFKQEPLSKTANFSWLRRYAQRFPDPTYQAIFERFPAKSYRDLGGIP